MLRDRRALFFLTCALLAAGIVLAFGQRASEKLERVLVTNFPELYEVQGQVRVRGPVHLAESLMLEETLVSPVEPEETTNLIDGGVIELSGFSRVVLSLAVESKAEVTREGRVGAYLVPETNVTTRAFREEGELLFPLEVVAQVGAGGNYFASNQPVYSLGFPRYRVYYWNTTNKSVAATLFAYLGS